MFLSNANIPLQDIFLECKFYHWIFFEKKSSGRLKFQCHLVISLNQEDTDYKCDIWHISICTLSHPDSENNLPYSSHDTT